MDVEQCTKEMKAFDGKIRAKIKKQNISKEGKLRMTREDFSASGFGFSSHMKRVIYVVQVYQAYE